MYPGLPVKLTVHRSILGSRKLSKDFILNNGAFPTNGTLCPYIMHYIVNRVPFETWPYYLSSSG